MATNRNGNENFNLIKGQDASDQVVDRVCLESWGSMSQKLSYSKSEELILVHQLHF